MRGEDFPFANRFRTEERGHFRLVQFNTLNNFLKFSEGEKDAESVIMVRLQREIVQICRFIVNYQLKWCMWVSGQSVGTCLEAITSSFGNL